MKQRKDHGFTIGPTWKFGKGKATRDGKPIPHEVARQILGGPVWDELQREKPAERNGVCVMTAVDGEKGKITVEAQTGKRGRMRGR